MPKPLHKPVVALGGVLAAWRLLWPVLETMDVLDGAGSLLAPVIPFFRDHWLDALSLTGVALIVYEVGRSREWWPLRQRRTSEPEPVAESPQPLPSSVISEPLAVPENAERLLDLFRHWDQALSHAAYVLEREICAYGSSEETKLLSYAIRSFPLEISNRKLIELRQKFEYFNPREATQSTFSTLRAELRQTLQECNFLLVFWINKGGSLIRGEQLLSVPVYIGLCDVYKEALEAARLLRFHSELILLCHTDGLDFGDVVR